MKTTNPQIEEAQQAKRQNKHKVNYSRLYPSQISENR